MGCSMTAIKGMVVLIRTSVRWQASWHTYPIALVTNYWVKSLAPNWASSARPAFQKCKVSPSVWEVSSSAPHKQHLAVKNWDPVCLLPAQQCFSQGQEQVLGPDISSSVLNHTVPHFSKKTDDLNLDKASVRIWHLYKIRLDILLFATLAKVEIRISLNFFNCLAQATLA